jgi:hypothetical protein
MSQEFEKDEYRLKPILDKHLMYSEALLSDLDQHLDKTLTSYLDKDKEPEKHWAKVAFCYLQMALRDTVGGSREDLAERIQLIADDYYNKGEGRDEHDV